MDLDAPPDGFLLSDLLAASIIADGDAAKDKIGSRNVASKEGDLKKSKSPVTSSGAS